METLEDRKKTILRVIVEQYVEQAHPVGSRSIQRDAGLEWSASTLRGEMNELERLGFITHPHTSAGRVPTDKGYRYYVDDIMQPKPLTQEISKLLQSTYEKQFRSAEEIFERTLKVLSSVSHLVSLVLISGRESFVIKSVTLIALESSFVSVIWLSDSGLTKSFVVNMGERLPEEELIQLNRVLNGELTGYSCEEIQFVAMKRFEKQRNSLRKVYRHLCQVVEELVQDEFQEKVYSEGSAALFRQPEFNKGETIQPILDVLESKSLIQTLMRESLSDDGVKIRIGTRDSEEFLKECALISIPYRLQGRDMGTIGLLGPKRMHYGQLTNLVSDVAGRMNESFERWI